MAGVIAFPSPIFGGQDFQERAANNTQWTLPIVYGPADPVMQIILDDVVTKNVINVLDRTEVGSECRQFQFDYYYRVYVTPSSISLGNLVSSQIRTFDVWNAHFVSKNNSDLTFTGDATGIILTEPFPTPTVFAGLEVRTYQIQFDLNGPATIQIEYTWDFPGEFPTLTVTGNRAIIWSIPPDWSDPITERYEWLTQIIEAEDGYEDRYRLRVNPRRSMEFRFLIDQREKRWMERYLWSWKGRVFSVPLWMDCSFTTGAIAVDDTVINIDTTQYKSFVDNGIAILWDGYNNTEAVEILNVNPTTLDLVRGALNNWVSGTRIFPAQVARMREDVTTNQPTADITYGNIRFEFLENKAIPAVDAPLAYDDSTMLERAPNRADDLDLTWQSKYGLVDFGIHQPLVDERSSFPDIVTAMTFAEDTRADIWFWKEWLHARAGRWSKFYMPAYSRDFTLVSDVAFNSASIEVVDDEYRTFYNLHPVKRDIALFKSDGTVVFRRITSVAEKAPAGSGVEVLTIDSPTGVDFPVAETKMISFVHPVRLDNDGVDIQWDSVQVARFNFNVRAIPQ